MKESRLLILLILGCLITQSLTKPAKDDKGDKKEDGDAKKGADGSGGTPEDIRENPEDPKTYIDHGQKKFTNVQGSIDKHFEKKRVEGEKIHTDGEASQAEAAHVQGKIEKGQYDKMYETFKYTDNEFDQAGKKVEDDGHDGNATAKGGEKGTSAPAGKDDDDGDDDDEDDKGSTGPPSDKKKKGKKAAKEGDDDKTDKKKKKKKKGKKSAKDGADDDDDKKEEKAAKGGDDKEGIDVTGPKVEKKGGSTSSVL